MNSKLELFDFYGRNVFFIYKLLYIFQRPFDTKYKDSITWAKDLNGPA